MSFLIVTVGRNCEPWVDRCLDSIAKQQGQDFRVCVIDDASEDATADKARARCEQYGFTFLQRTEPVGAMRNQHDAWWSLEPTEEDVVVWVDLDDHLPHENVLNRVAKEYQRGVLLTYGSYEPEPASATCPPARAYPRQVIQSNGYRFHGRRGRGLLYNHLRTVSWQVLKHLGMDDLTDMDGIWWQSTPDAAVMIPCLELAGPRHAFIPDTLLIYNSENPYSEWRRWPERVNRDHQDLLSRTPKRRLR